jgi:tRNA modification GTPase
MLLDALADSRIIGVFNKTDLESKFVLADDDIFAATVNIVALTGEGIDLLKQTICKQFLHSSAADKREYILLSRARHRDALASAEQYLKRFFDGLHDLNLELLALDLRGALDSIGEVTGQTATDEVLDLIFASFCIGK